MGLRIYALGSFSVFRGEDVITDDAFVTQKAKSLLKVLLTYQPHFVASDQCYEWLWPDADPDAAAAGLRSAVSRLRHALEPELTRYAPSQYIAKGRGGYCLNLGSPPGSPRAHPAWTDVAEFESQAATGRRLDEAGHDQEAAAAYRDALALYRGEYLEEDRYADWAAAERERLRELFLGLHTSLADVYGRLRRFEQAAGACRDALAVDDCRESTWRQLMLYLHSAGDQAQALRAFDACRAVLRDTLGAEPAPATRALYEQIRANEPDTAPNSTRTRNRLPISKSRFVGRESELAAVARWIALPDERLLTLVGPGGCGKTRLALQAAGLAKEAFAHGTRFAALAPETSPARLVGAIADACGLTLERWQEPKAQLVRFVEDKQLLLVLDNFEQVLDGAPLVEELLDAAPLLKVLATSRESLQVASETVLDMGGLDLPPEGMPAQEVFEHHESYSAIELFQHLAQRAYSRFNLTAQDTPAVVRICWLLGGLPLGIELAAAWVRVLDCSEIASEIERNLDFLAARGGTAAHERHRSMRAVFEHSWQLLSDEERRVFKRLSVFRGGFGRETAEAVAGTSLSTLLALTYKSILARDTDGRYHMHGLLAQWAAERLAADSGEAWTARGRHAAHFAAFLSSREARLVGIDPKSAVAEIDAEIENVRVAWTNAAADRQLAVLEEAIEGMFLYFDLRSSLSEGCQAISYAIDRLQAGSYVIDTPQAGSYAIDTLQAGADPTTAVESRHRLLGQLMARQAMMTWRLGHVAEARALLRESLALLRPFAPGRELAFALYTLGYLLGAPPSPPEVYGEAAGLLEESLAIYRARGEHWRVARVLNALGLTATSHGDLGIAIQVLEDGLAVARACGDRRTTAHILDYLGSAYQQRGEFATAVPLHEESLAIFRDLGIAWGSAQALISLASAYLKLGDRAAAMPPLEESLAIGRGIGIPWVVEISLSLMEDCNKKSTSPG